MIIDDLALVYGDMRLAIDHYTMQLGYEIAAKKDEIMTNMLKSGNDPFWHFQHYAFVESVIRDRLPTEFRIDVRVERIRTRQEEIELAKYYD